MGSGSKERIREQKVIKAEQESVILDFWSRYQDYRKAEDENETEEEESLKEELKAPPMAKASALGLDKGSSN